MSQSNGIYFKKGTNDPLNTPIPTNKTELAKYLLKHNLFDLMMINLTKLKSNLS